MTTTLPSSLNIGCWPVARSMIDSLRWPNPRPGSTCIAPASGPRWCCDSFIRDRSSRLTSRVPRVSRIPTMPHMARLRESDSAVPAVRVGTRRISFGERMVMEKFGVQSVVLLDHALEAELACCAVAACTPMASRRRRIAEISDDAFRQRVAVRRRNDVAGRTVFDKLAVCPNMRGDDGQARSHRLQHGIRNALTERRQNEAIEAAQDRRHVGALTGKPRQVAEACLVQDRLHLWAQRPVTDKHESHARARVAMHRNGRDECTGEIELVLDRFHAPDGSDEPVARSVERATLDGNALLARRTKALGVDAVVDLRDSSRSD